MAGNKTVVLVSRPAGMVSEDIFAVADLDVPTVEDGQILVRNQYASLDPGIRKTLAETNTYWVPTPLGAPLTANVVGEVIESRHPGFQSGDLVVGTGQLQEISAFAPGPMCWKIDPASELPLSASLGILGATGLTAYFGLIEVGQPKVGETVLVSGAAGAVGSAVGQIAKIKGCRVVGIAGGPVKTKRLVEEFGFDAAIDYRGKTREQLEAEIRLHCPNGVDVFFDNVGGIQLDAALANMNWKGRMAICGLISEYNLDGPPAPMQNLFSIVGKTLRVEGFLSFVYADLFPQALREMEQWIKEGRLVWREHVEDGIESAPGVFVMGAFSCSANVLPVSTSW
ncbi:NADP-dependent oxidoreductase [Aquisediminimonas sediminicola]|uniref:NADP-dependent oxidoreductase n=1 Tax=Alteraquisediminimonas sediminicola TaxID=2676787 RepID=UPI001C8DB0B2|nr:NADP-dependent oxidoreductase [Aquisediminimonas sediminicola]